MTTKPEKPYADFPLYAHRNGQWAKKIRGATKFFGTWPDPQAALDLYKLQREALYAGEPAPQPASSLTIADACSEFLTAKMLLLESGEITRRTYDDYEHTCTRVSNAFGRTRAVQALTPGDFDKLRAKLARTLGAVALGNEINRVRILFKFLVDADLVDKPIRHGPHFRRPSAKLVRLEKERRGLKLFAPAELHVVLSKASPTMAAMIMLGVNCGLGNSDVGQLRFEHLELNKRWLNYPRPKTGIYRRARLWPETVAKLKAAIKTRTKPARDEMKDLVFITKYGDSWHKESVDNPVSKEMIKALSAAEVRRPGLCFYALRHTFQTIGDESGDLAAVKFIMGHAPKSDDMSANYRRMISDERLQKVAEHVRKWLFRKAKRGQKAS